ncbi:cation/H(+) antiporter 15-like [Hibiscus syriacus]|uniref:Cation/H(+) antiporter 15-like n=1 Tax=Hibiscus syriacus TaxID=106335 RepID=A0A6A3B929_HIBSY|nr:uncharacterized protein LOC120114542 [Hibiscus syriacus]KAE8712751.1 cation/H(+) antiporter 15-like [Hibiscus syriacus]
MGNSLRCCLACVLPCGALDLIRIVHLNGHVEEITRPVTAGEILHANPNHILTRPSSQGVARKISIISPGSQLKRGGIYFLIPKSSLLYDEKKKNHLRHKKSFGKSKKCDRNEASDSDRCSLLNTSISETKRSGRDHRDCRNSRGRVWQLISLASPRTNNFFR